MGWSFRRSKSFGLFRLNFSKSGIGYSFGVKGARVGVSAKGKNYVRGGIPGTGLYYQSTLPDGQPGESPQPPSSVSPLGILIALMVVGFIIFAISSSTSTKITAPVAPVPQVVAPVAAPVVHKHPVKKHKRKHVNHRAPAMTTKPDEVPVAEPANPDVTGDGRS
jgi:hypothetical protein